MDCCVVLLYWLVKCKRIQIDLIGYNELVVKDDRTHRFIRIHLWDELLLVRKLGAFILMHVVPALI